MARTHRLTILENGRPRERNPVMVDAFVAEYLNTLKPSHSARVAGWTGKHVAGTAWCLLRDPKIRARIDEGLRARFGHLKLDDHRVLSELWDILQADANELIEHRRGCCRCCHGAGFKHQRTQGEMDRDRKQHERDRKAYVKMGMDLVEPFTEFDEQGGAGYDATQDPNEECPECFGEGESRVVLKDTRDLSPAARALYAGVKVTKDGVEVKMHSKDKAIELLGRHLALFNDKLDLNVKGDLAQRILKARKRTSNEDLV